MADEVTAVDGLPDDDARRLYEEICANVRTTDDISFKLLGLVPFVSGAGVAILLSTNTDLSSLPTVVFVGLLGAVITYGLLRWELRNIQTCRHLIAVGEDLEKRLGLPRGQFLGRPQAPIVRGRRVGKTEAETLIYVASIVAWLLLPVVAAIGGSID
jgi:hypothetical protein